MSADLLVVVLGIGSVSLRVAPVLVGAPVGRGVDRLLQRAGTAALAALVAGDVAGAGSSGALAAMVAGLAVGVVLKRRGASMLAVIAGGAPIYALLPRRPAGPVIRRAGRSSPVRPPLVP